MSTKSPQNPSDLDDSTRRDLRRRIDFDDARLLRECDVHMHRSSGPGGQHRNKVSTAIRLVHRASGLTVTATESRSQQENKVRACRRLREAIALAIRLPLPAVVPWPETVQIQAGVLRVNEKNPAKIHVIALVLDALATHTCHAADAAKSLGVSTTSLRRFLKDHPTAQRQLASLRQSGRSASQDCGADS